MYIVQSTIGNVSYAHFAIPSNTIVISPLYNKNKAISVHSCTKKLVQHILRTVVDSARSTNYSEVCTFY